MWGERKNQIFLKKGSVIPFYRKAVRKGGNSIGGSYRSERVRKSTQPKTGKRRGDKLNKKKRGRLTGEEGKKRKVSEPKKGGGSSLESLKVRP